MVSHPTPPGEFVTTSDASEDSECWLTPTSAGPSSSLMRTSGLAAGLDQFKRVGVHYPVAAHARLCQRDVNVTSPNET